VAERNPAEPGGPWGAPSRRALLLAMARRTIRDRPRDYAGLAVWSGVQALPSLASGWAVARSTADFLAGRAVAGLGWLAVLGLSALAGALASRQVYLRVAAIVEPLRDDLVAMIVTGALRQAMSDRGGPRDTGAVARITHQAEIVRDCFGGLLAVGLGFIFTAVSALIGLAVVVPAVLPFAIVPVAVSVAAFWSLLPAFAARQRRSLLAEEAVATAAAAALTGLRDVIACGAEEQVRLDLTGRVDTQAAALRATAAMNLLRTLVLAVGGWLPLVLVLADAPSLLRHGAAPAALLGAATYVGGVMPSALYTLTRGAGSSGVRLAITLQRILEASAPDAAPGLCGTAPGRSERGPGVAPCAARGGLSLRGVSFAYGPHCEPILRDLELDIPDGDHVAIVGPSGIGKSTLTALIAGLLQPLAGEVRIGGVPLPEIPAADRPRYRVLIPQEAYVFAGTLGENLGYLAPTATEPELDAAVAAIGMEALAARLGGYAAELSPGSLSAGERQLVALTRAYLSPARLAILDEATCHLDPGGADRAERAFAERPGTLLVVAHRISSALSARRVLVLDGARPLLGDHQTLLAAAPLYRELVGHWHGGPVTPPAVRPS
jgi:ABC-type multidrug transport system fused ATPase/permease subunit